MQLATLKFLDSIEVEEIGGTVLQRARTIFKGEVNDKLNAYQIVHHISQSVYRRGSLIKIMELEGLSKEEGNNLLFSINLILLKLRIFSILDQQDANKVWSWILQEENLEKIRNAANFFYHIGHGPGLLLSELLSNGLFPENNKDRLSDIFPRGCIEEDYHNGLSVEHKESETSEEIIELERELEEETNGDSIRVITRQLEVLRQNAARYL